MPLQKDSVVNSKTDSLVFTNDEFVSDPFPGEVNIHYLNSRYPEIKVLDKEAVENRHQPGVMDTIYTLGLNHSRFNIYKAGNKEIFYQATITHPDFQFKKGIHVGMAGGILLEKLSAENHTEKFPETLVVKNSNKTVELVFKLNNNRLSKVIYNGYLD
ncbi:MAG: hypothetical protein WAN36_07975 [Calditrichia bacterium]